MWGKYVRQKQIGVGGMGEVWLVSEKSSRGLFAAKYLLPSLGREKDYLRFIREIELLSSLDHPHIIKIIDVSRDSKHPGYVMEYCPEGSLTNINQTLDDVIQTIRQLSSATSYLHAKGIIHRDIKPTNILVAPDGSLRISDFGLSFHAENRGGVVTTSNWVSAGYSSPEQYRDMSSVTDKTDVFSIGAVLYSMLTGRCIDITANLEDQLQNINGLFRFILERCLKYDASVRISSQQLLELTSDCHYCKFDNYLKVPDHNKEDYFKIQYEDCKDPQAGWGGDMNKLDSTLDLFKFINRWEIDIQLQEVAKNYIESINADIDMIVQDAIQTNPSY